MTRHIRPRYTVSMLAVLLAMSGASAPARADAPDTRPVPQANGWWDINTGAAAAPGSMSNHRLPERDHLEGVTDYPSGQMNAWVIANAMAARAGALHRQAESDLQMTIRRVQNRFEHSPEYAQVQFAQQQAYADYSAARQKILVMVADDPKYHAISLLRDQMGEKIANRRSAKDVTNEELLAMATLKMQYAADARAIEVAALDNDANLKSAREKMVSTTKQMNDLRAHFDNSIADNPEVVLARKNLDESRISLIETAAMEQGAAIASEYAVNYSYFLHRNDNGGTFGPYGPNGVYGNYTPVTYTSPYWGR